jgi:hypothetical protein
LFGVHITCSLTSFVCVNLSKPASARLNSRGCLQVNCLFKHTACCAAPGAVAEHMQEASSGSSWHRKEVSLAVLQDGSNPSTLSDYGEQNGASTGSLVCTD